MSKSPAGGVILSGLEPRRIEVVHGEGDCFREGQQILNQTDEFVSEDRGAFSSETSQI